MNDKMREKFESAYVEGLVQRCGEGFRSTALYSLTEKRPDGEYQNYTDFIAWWAWKASRAAMVIELPPIWEESPNTALGQACAQIRTADIEAIKAAGLKVANQ